MNTPNPITSSQAYVGIQYGYIIIPSDVDRDKFIQQCYRWERVSVLFEKGAGVFHDCYITKEAIKEIEFPAVTTQLGSCVLFITDILNGHPIVFGVLSKEDESQMLREGFFKMMKTYHGNSVTVSGDAVRGVVNIAVTGGALTQLNITASNNNKNAVINIRCQGDINLEMNGKLKVNGGSQAMVKGNALKTDLDKTNDLLQALLNIISGTPIPEPGNGLPSALQTALQTAISGKALGDYSDIKSEESFLD